MADAQKPAAQAGDRRTFLKIGAGVVAGAAIATVVEVPYYSSVIGGNNNSSSSTVSSLSDQLSSTQSQLSDTQSALAATQSQLSDTQSSLTAAQGTISNLNSQLSSSSAALSSANGQVSSLNSQLTSTQGALNSANSQVSSLQGQVSSANSQVTTLQGQVTSLQGQVTSASSQVSSLQSSLSATQDLVDEGTAFLSLSTTEQVELEAIVEAIIPSDSTGPGAKEAGAIYFIDNRLRTEYGTDGLLYRKGPFIPANVQSGFSVQGTNWYTSPPTLQEYTYPGGSVTYTAGGTNYTVNYTPTANVRVTAGTRYQYPFDMKQFWTIGLAGIQNYSNAQYGSNFEDLNATQQTQVLTDLWNNKPTYDGANGSLSGGGPGGYQQVVENINSIASGVPGGTQFGAVLPSDFAYELFFMAWNGFFTCDPVYGGNKGMVGWSYVGWRGVNMGNFYGEGYTPMQLMVANTPIKLNPVSLGQYQKGSP